LEGRLLYRLLPSTPPEDEHATNAQTRAAARYFAALVDDYRQAYRGRGRGVVQRAVNRLFRSTACRQRIEIVEALLARDGVAAKQVLDLGCGTGAASIAAARLGASVTGLDIVAGMIEAARHEADAAGFSDRIDFRVHDITQPFAETADVTLLIGVVEYYRDLAAVVGRAARATRERLIIQDTAGPWWRRTLRLVVARVNGFALVYRSPDEVASAVRRFGFVETDRIAGSSFTILAFRRPRSPA
jgi:SAM-dependent methyltransferase